MLNLTYALQCDSCGYTFVWAGGIPEREARCPACKEPDTVAHFESLKERLETLPKLGTPGVQVITQGPVNEKLFDFRIIGSCISTEKDWVLIHIMGKEEQCFSVPDSEAYGLKHGDMCEIRVTQRYHYATVDLIPRPDLKDTPFHRAAKKLDLSFLDPEGYWDPVKETDIDKLKNLVEEQRRTIAKLQRLTCPDKMPRNPEFVKQITGNPEFVKRVEEGWKDVDAGRIYSLEELKEKLGDG